MDNELKSIVKWAVTIVIVFTTAAMGGCPMYGVWEQGLKGQAELARAEQNRQIKVQEATATKESAHLLSEADVIRAQGAATANLILGDSLKNNEAYLRYLFIQSMEHTKNQIIYIPTEAGLPVLEAGRLVPHPEKK